MACTITFRCSSVVWNGNTWTASDGGIIECSYNHSGSVNEFRVGDQVWPTVIATTDKHCTASVILREVGQEIDLDETVDDLVLTIAGRAGDVPIITIKSVMLIDVSASQRRSEWGAVILSFLHQSQDGTTVPIS